MIFKIDKHHNEGLIFRFDLTDKSQIGRLQSLDKIISEFGPQSPGMVNSMIFPEPVAKRLGFDTVYRMRELFDFFRDLYDDHERTFDDGDMRDFVDVYCAERKRANEEERRDSSFYGDVGDLNFVNTMFDFFLVRYPR